MPLQELDTPVSIPDDPSNQAALPLETPPAETAPAPAAAAPEAPAAKPEAPPVDKHVPIQAMLEERSKRQALQKQMAEMAAKTEAMERRFQELLKRAEPPPPAFEENPAEHLKSRLDMTEQQLKAWNERAAQEQAAQKQAQDAQALHAFVEQHEQGFRAQAKDYDAAVQHLQQARAQEFITLGYSPSEAQMMVYRDALAIAWEARARERNPAEVFYALAKQRGYAPAPAAPAPSATQKAALETVAAGIAKTQSLGPSGGGDADLTLAKLAEMDDSEFDKATSGENWRKLWR